MILEHKVTLVLSIGLKPKVCNKSNTAMRRPPTARRERSTVTDTQHRETFKHNFKYGCRLKSFFKKINNF